MAYTERFAAALDAVVAAREDRRVQLASDPTPGEIRQWHEAVAAAYSAVAEAYRNVLKASSSSEHDAIRWAFTDAALFQDRRAMECLDDAHPFSGGAE